MATLRRVACVRGSSGDLSASRHKCVRLAVDPAVCPCVDCLPLHLWPRRLRGLLEGAAQVAPAAVVVVVVGHRFCFFRGGFASVLASLAKRSKVFVLSLKA